MRQPLQAAKTRKNFFLSFIHIFSFICRSFFRLPGWATQPISLYSGSVKDINTLPNHGAQTLETSDSSTPSSSGPHFFVTFHKFCFPISPPAPYIRPLSVLPWTTVNTPNRHFHPCTSGLKPQVSGVHRTPLPSTTSGLLCSSLEVSFILTPRTKWNTDSFLEPPEGMQVCQHLILPSEISNLQNCNTKFVLC